MKKSVTFLMAALLVIISFLLGKGCSSSQPVQQSGNPVPATSSSQSVRATDVVSINPEAASQAHFELLTIEPNPKGNQLVTTGDIQPDDNKVFHINSFVGGRVRQESALLGDFITAGQSLAIVQNLEVAKIKATYIHESHLNEIEVAQAKTRLALANRTLERERRLLAEGISPRKDYYQAETDASIAATALRGAKEHATHIRTEAQALLSAYGTGLGSARSEQIQTDAVIKAPRAGVILKKTITVGDMVTPDMVLYEVADLSTVWLNIAIYPKDFTSVHLGQTVTFISDTLPNTIFSGTVDYLPPTTTTPQSPIFTARAFLKNPKGLLKTGMFGQVTITLPPTKNQSNLLFLPERAVQQLGAEKVVFKVIAPNQYRKQVVELGEKTTGGYWVKKGVSRADKVVGDGSFILKAELLKSQSAQEGG